ncbi:hypothetical protein HW555_010389 [Spodoptera exigua]|uniref:Uncharacterized protein n=1 Tax=Spodoptera exigua TaxID=7107 RepID=A0A835G7E6_SPOEX|nr:hypothetical protein HW555_010389 [Spodoptera exigua]
MSTDNYQVQNFYKYSRRTFKKNNYDGENTNFEGADVSPRSDLRSDGRMDSNDSPRCSCDLDPEGEIANILHKKCPVITLAQQQLTRLLDETDKLLCDNTRCCRSVYDFVCLCKEIFLRQDKGRVILIMLIGMSFLAGVLLGAASCGSYLGRFNSPILNCVDNLFAHDRFSNVEDTYRSIV